MAITTKGSETRHKANRLGAGLPARNESRNCRAHIGVPRASTSDSGSRQWAGRVPPVSGSHPMRHCFYIAVGGLALANAASAGGPTLEYRFKVPDGVEFKWRDGKVEKLDRQPFMVTSDFGNAIAIKSTNPKAPDAFEIDLVHNKPGKQKYRARAKAEQPREYCALFNDVVLQCYALAPQLAALYEGGGTIYGPFSKTEAQEMARKINLALH